MSKTTIFIKLILNNFRQIQFRTGFAKEEQKQYKERESYQKCVRKNQMWGNFTNIQVNTRLVHMKFSKINYKKTMT